MASESVRSGHAEGPLVSVRGLGVEFPGPHGWVKVVDDVSFTIERSHTMGLVGESGSGKTVTSLAMLGLVGALGGRVEGEVIFEGRDVLRLSQRDLRHVRGARVGTIFQQPVRSLDPAFTVGEQISETIRRHDNVTRKQAWSRAVEALDHVGIPDAARRAHEYPHTFSGGMCQRVMIAMALSCSPSLLIADEPTTAVDVTVQARILDLLRDLQHETGIAILFVSHDLGVIAEMCDAVTVMYAGQVVERSGVDELFLEPRHPYTAGLLGAVPRVGLGRRLRAIPGNVPDPHDFSSACRFHTRCPHAVPGRCDVIPPELEGADTHAVRCLRADELQLHEVVRDDAATR